MRKPVPFRHALRTDTKQSGLAQGNLSPDES